MSNRNIALRALVVVICLTAFAPTLALAESSTTTCKKVDLWVYVWEKCTTTTSE